MSNVILKIKDFGLHYGKKEMLKKINISVTPNTVVSIIGPSGCGKSTLLKSINRINDYVENCNMTGEILFHNLNVADRKVSAPEVRTKIGMVFQKPNPFPMSIYDNVAYGPKTHGTKNKAELNKIVEDSLKAAALWDEVKDNLKGNALKLSGGQQQRLCIARAIALQPEILLMDEPTSALDPIATSKIEDLIIELKNKFTIILVTHSMSQAVRVSDYTIFLIKGEVVEQNETRKLFSVPQDKRTEDYINRRYGD